MMKQLEKLNYSATGEWLRLGEEKKRVRRRRGEEIKEIAKREREGRI